jgi:hypothetical protein
MSKITTSSITNSFSDNDNHGYGAMILLNGYSRSGYGANASGAKLCVM